MSKWSELPKELLEIIGNNLDSRIDVFRFRAVSNSWRSMVSPDYLYSQPISFHLPPPICRSIIMTRFTICRLEDPMQTSSACLVKVIESSSSSSFSSELKLVHPLMSPLTNTNHNFQVSNQDDHNKNNSNDSINMLDFRLVELTKGYSFVFEFNGSLNECRIKKAVLFGSKGVIVLLDSGKLWYWVFGAEDWVHLGSEGSHYDDIMVCKNRYYYVIDDLGTIHWIDDRSLKFVQYSTPLCGLGNVKTLVECEGELYVVDSYQLLDGGFDFFYYRRRFPWVDVKVYRLDEEWGTWVDVKSLGNRVFVLGKQLSYSVNVTDFPGCPGDCIYLVDPRVEDIRVFRFDNGSIRTLDCFPAYKRLFTPPRNCSQMHIPQSP